MIGNLVAGGWDGAGKKKGGGLEVEHETAVMMTERQIAHCYRFSSRGQLELETAWRMAGIFMY